MNRLSIYSDDPRMDGVRVWTSRYTRESVPVGPATREHFPELLACDLAVMPKTPRDALLQLLVRELTERGLIVPTDIQNEELHLDEISPVRPATALFDLPKCRYDRVPVGTRVAVFGVASSLGGKHPGAEEGPNILRRMSRRFSWRGKSAQGTFVASTKQKVFDQLSAVDMGDIEFNRRDFDFWVTAVERVVSSAPEGTIPFMIGGDHSFTFAAISAIVKKSNRPLKVVQLDQHLDVQLEGTFANGKPSKLVPLTHANMMSRVRELHPSMRIVQLGLDHFQTVDPRYVDDAGKYLDYVGVQVSDLEIADLSDEDLQRLIGGGDDVYLTIDVDVLERSAMASTGFPADVGVSFIRLLKILKVICRTNRIVGVDVMEFGVPEAQRGTGTYSDAYRALLIIAQLLNDLARNGNADGN